MLSRIIIRLAIAVVIFNIAFSSACVKRKDTRVTRDLRNRSIEQVFDAHRASLLSTPGVVGAGIAKLNDKPCIMVMVRERDPDLENHIPKQLDGYDVIIEVTGDFKPLDSD